MTDPDHIRAWRRIDERTTTSGQPTEDQLKEIRDLGATHVVNLGLHTHADALADEAASVAALGMRYVHIPVEFDRPTEADFGRFRAVMDDVGDATVHVHCIANMRVSAFFYRYRRDMLGMPEAEAREAMETVWRPGGVWAEFIGDEAAVGLAHRGPRLQDDGADP